MVEGLPCSGLPGGGKELVNKRNKGGNTALDFILSDPTNDAVRKFLKLPIVVITALTLIHTILFIPQYESAAQIDTASLQVACSRKIFGVRQWQDVLTAMSKSIQTIEMKFNFEAGMVGMT